MFLRDSSALCCQLTPFRTISIIGKIRNVSRASQVALVVKNPPSCAGDARNSGPIPGSGRSPEVGHGHLLQYSCLKIPWTEEPGGLQSMGSQKSWIRISDCTHTQTQLIGSKSFLDSMQFGSVSP